MTARDQQSILQILERCHWIREFTIVGKSAFLASREKQEATVRCLEVIGEASRRISAPTRRAWPKVPWEDMAELRNLLIHEYESVKPSEVWSTVERVIPQIEKTVGRIRL
jgi:uncharacterized protein with HEPN domain